jgi:hypothetical protein
LNAARTTPFITRRARNFNPAGRRSGRGYPRIMLISGQPHARPTRTRTRWPKLKKLSPSGSEADANARIARICVLFEDLRIELIGLDLLAPSVIDSSAQDTHFDVAGYRLRRIYFLRRSIGTCCEFAEALRLLNETDAFQPILANFGQPAHAAWRESVQYFRDHERLWREIRNDVGGHFGEAAARFAVENFLNDAFGSLEIRWDDRSESGDCVLAFASEIAATGLLKRLPEPTLEGRTNGLFTRVVDAYGQAIRAVHCLVREHLWPRTGS